ncbi:PilW family protein [Bremerella alba]|uniref:Prepilin-type N-terminal cleavage/methylation domain-containing protein n=1 Tax=Bremerella alba TaxID=980252 RepID=A0A7V9A8E4_9BACT|nr:hypothetical protein [Bremerella alba]MBA2116362.1 hypothetical protein [Bremerella alba]
MWNTRTPHIATQTRGLTLVEMLMATALTLIMFAAVAQIFGMMGTAMRDARATIELSGNLRSVSTHLQNDLDNVSVDVLPWVQPGANQGYFEIIEGPDRDVDFATSDIIDDTEFPDFAGVNGGLTGDADDVICFTAYSKDQPFVGLIQGELMPNVGGYTNVIPHKFWVDRTDLSLFTTITSHYAEIVYFTKHTPVEDTNANGQRDADETVTLYRRVLLIRPDIFVGNPNTMAPPASHTLTYAEAMNYYDLSMWSASNSEWQTNSLEDLQSRDRRVAHAPYAADGIQVDEDSGGTAINLQVGGAGAGFDPAPLRPHALLTFEQLNHALQWSPSGTNNRDRTGEDVMLTNTLAFDVRIFDPIAAVGRDAATSSLSLAPGDPGYGAADFTDAMQGAFVDLNWSRTSPTAGTDYYNQTFQNFPNTKSQLNNVTIYGGNSSSIFGSTTPTTKAILNSSFFLQNPTMLSTGSLNYAYYDTWPFYYEVDGVDQNGDGVIDEGTNGFDDDGDDIVDEHFASDLNDDGDTSDAGEESELETEPPYSKALRAVSVTVRVIEEGTRQVRQDTIVADFLPE